MYFLFLYSTLNHKCCYTFKLTNFSLGILRHPPVRLYIRLQILYLNSNVLFCPKSFNSIKLNSHTQNAIYRHFFSSFSWSSNLSLTPTFEYRPTKKNPRNQNNTEFVTGTLWLNEQDNQFDRLKSVQRGKSKENICSSPNLVKYSKFSKSWIKQMYVNFIIRLFLYG